jgi:hypothetical protein
MGQNNQWCQNGDSFTRDESPRKTRKEFLGHGQSAMPINWRQNNVRIIEIDLYLLSKRNGTKKITSQNITNKYFKVQPNFIDKNRK